ncbi:hypothetical protein EYF80_067404 [Liparis tanakae]|uniref:Uncharacterized protein n=1 Tax=Liparis tanakae TaxID=230148 RepID=A0A4Z2E280_9TELE|nr:hypothetical protein EYF80_067404 [Liparis tanakae]
MDAVPVICAAPVNERPLLASARSAAAPVTPGVSLEESWRKRSTLGVRRHWPRPLPFVLLSSSSPPTGTESESERGNVGKTMYQTLLLSSFVLHVMGTAHFFAHPG